MSLRSLILSLVLACVSLTTQGEQPADPSGPGPWPVGYQQLSFTDSSRDLVAGGRTLPVHIWYPAAAGDSAESAVYVEGGFLQLPAQIALDAPAIAADERWPLIIFSHGFGGTPIQSTPVMEVLASHGFVVASVDHIGNSQSESPIEKDRPQAQADRVPDVTYVIDTLLALNRDSASDWYRRLHPLQIGVTGHSYGGSTSMALAVGEFSAPAVDPRVKAIVPVSGDMEYFSDAALASVKIPLLMLNGTLDTAVPPSNSARAYELSPAAQPAWRVDIAGATHTHFANICSIADALIALGLDQDAWPGIGAEDLIEPYRDTCVPEAFPIDQAEGLQKRYTVAFFKVHIQGDHRYMRYLNQHHQEASVTLWRKSLLPWIARSKVW